VHELQLGRAWRELQEAEGGAEVVEAAVHHSMTWSARASSDGGIVGPSALAVVERLPHDAGLSHAARQSAS
jgi:hypothetical protein